MRVSTAFVALLLAAASSHTGSALQPARTSEGATVVLNNARVRAYRTTANALAGVSHAPGVVIWIRDSAGGKAGRAVWVDDAAGPQEGRDEIVIVQPLGRASAQNRPRAGSRPGDASFTGMSFVPLFENTRVSVLSARMDVDAREGMHTHGSDTIVVHLSGGEIEDTANGKTVVNRWKPGDVEFESRGSSHSARNTGKPVDVVLVALK